LIVFTIDPCQDPYFINVLNIEKKRLLSPFMKMVRSLLVVENMVCTDSRGEIQLDIGGRGERRRGTSR